MRRRLESDTPCSLCGGRGRRVYGSTSTWREGMGGAAMTADVCDRCWGSGDDSEPFGDLREWRAEARGVREKLAAAEKRIREIAEVPCVEHPSSKRTPMRCFPKDRCTFCRCREAVAQFDAKATP
jgi:hypothetical protein